MIKFSQIKSFDWDNYNINKNWLKHNVTPKECEEVFFDKNNKMLSDALHSDNEKRFIIVGRTFKKRLLFVAFIVRRNEIRIISARDIKKKKEIKLYEKRA